MEPCHTRHRIRMPLTETTLLSKIFVFNHIQINQRETAGTQVPVAFSTLWSDAVWMTVALMGVLITIFNLSRWVSEVRFLRRTLRELFPGGRIRAREDLVRLKNHLSDRIRFNPDKKFDRRPLLRETASTTLMRGEGFCGENARVAILLLALGGVRANRLYVVGPKWGHVVVEHEWEKAWKLFDAHADPGTLPADETIGHIDSQDLSEFPNDYRDTNPWTYSYRIKLFRTLPGWLRELSQVRLPSFLVVYAESPQLIRASAAAIVVALAGVAWLS